MATKKTPSEIKKEMNKNLYNAFKHRNAYLKSMKLIHNRNDFLYLAALDKKQNVVWDLQNNIIPVEKIIASVMKGDTCLNSVEMFASFDFSQDFIKKYF